MFRPNRRELLLAAALAPAALKAPPAFAASAAYPARNIQFIIPFAPGGGFDVYVRVVAPAMEQYLPRKVSIVPVNVSAGGGARGVAQLYRARPDGQTIGIFNIPGLFILQEQQNGSTFDLAKISWIGSIGAGDHYYMAVGSNSPLKTFADLKALSERRPIKFSTTGPESTAYSASLIGAKLLGIRPQMITGYKGSADYMVAAVRGDSDVVVANRTAAARFVRGNSLRVLASFEPQSSIQGVPDAAALGQPELAQLTVERMVGAPPGLPADVLAILSGTLSKALGASKVIAWAKDNDLTLTIRSPEEVAALVARQRAFFEKWKDLIAIG